MTSIVSSKVGPSGMSGLSKTAVTASAPSLSSPSMLSSQPGTNSSIKKRFVTRPSGIGQNTADLSRGGEDIGVVVGADHATTAAQRHRLDHAGEVQCARSADQRLLVRIGGQDAESRLRDAVLRPRLPLHCLVRRGFDRSDRIVRPSPSSAASRAASGSIWLSTATTESTEPIMPLSLCALAAGSSGSTRTTGCPPSGKAPSLPMTTSSRSRCGRSDEVRRPVGDRRHQQQDALSRDARHRLAAE